MRSSPFSINAEVVEFSLDVRRYDRAPALSSEERSALSRVIRQLSEGKAASPFVGWPQLHRLLVPLLDLCHQLRVEERETSRSLTPFFVEMHQRGVSFWGWSEAEWIESIGLTRRACQQHHGNPSYLPRMEFLAAAYLFGGFSNFSVFPKNSISFARLANDVFGKPSKRNTVFREHAKIGESSKEIGSSKEFHPGKIRRIAMMLLTSPACQTDGLNPLCLAPAPKGNTTLVHLNKKRR